MLLLALAQGARPANYVLCFPVCQPGKHSARPVSVLSFLAALSVPAGTLTDLRGTEKVNVVPPVTERP